MAFSEFDYIRRIREATPADPRVVIPPGDDCGAVVGTGEDPLLVTVDMVAEGTDFLRTEHSPERIGRKALAVSLSDIAAMAADPIGAVVAVMLPADADAALQEGLHRGLRAVADEFDCPLIGGDTNAWPGKLVISTTVFGRPGSTPPVRRSGARPGDWVFVTGSLGGSILGRHLDFTPRVREARALSVAVRLTAMIDISDGLSSEIHHIARESGVGAVLRTEAVPVSDAARELAARDGKPALHHALHDGEDFELLFTVPEDDGRWLAGPGRGKVPGPVTHIGRITAEPGVFLETDGRLEPLKRGGWEHLASSAPGDPAGSGT